MKKNVRLSIRYAFDNTVFTLNVNIRFIS